MPGSRQGCDEGSTMAEYSSLPSHYRDNFDFLKNNFVHEYHYDPSFRR